MRLGDGPPEKTGFGEGCFRADPGNAIEGVVLSCRGRFP
jgi:hypothetical protein